MRSKSIFSKKHSQAIRKTNPVGFAKRRLRRAEATLGAGPDVYEYSSVKNKRANVTLSLDKDEAIGLGMDENPDVEFSQDALRARIMDTDRDAVINSDEDEEIESDDAFEESDEERFAGFSFAKKYSSKHQARKARKFAPGASVRFADVNLDENERGDVAEAEDEQISSTEEADGDNNEFLDVLDVLDGRGEPYFRDEEQDGKDEKEEGVGSEEEGEDEEEEVDDEAKGGDDIFAPSDGEQKSDEEAIDRLGAFVSQLESGKKRKADDGIEELPASSGPVNRKRRMLKERTETGVEGEFGVHAASGSKLQLDDLLTPLASTSSSLDALKKSIKPLTKNDALPAPLPQRTKDRLDREAAYEQTKEEVDKWKATMKRIKEADHLSFPLQVPQKVNPSNSELAAKFKPSTELESAVDKLLRSAHMRDESDIAKTEELKINRLSVEEVATRRAELRKTRELMFRAEAKAKRLAKIKSKTYRKILRKGRDRVKDLIQEAEGADAEDYEEERMKHEVDRARERATLRHKNTGKWAKAMKARGELDVDQRRDIEEMLDKSEKLRARIQGVNSSGEEDDDSGEDDIERIKAGAFEELRRLSRDGAANTPPDKAKGVFAMKFMQDAMAKEAKRVREAADDFRADMARLGDGGESESVIDDHAIPGQSGVQVQRTGGRLIFRPSQSTVPPRPIAPSESSSTLKSSEPALQSPVTASQPTVHSSPQPLDDSGREPSPHLDAPVTNAEPNPWLVSQRPVVIQSRRRNEVLVGKDSHAATKSKNTLRKQLMKNEEALERARDDANVEISMDEVLKLPDEDSETETQEHRTKTKGKGKGVKAFEQRDLVAMAFAGDNVVQDFEKLKEREIANDAPREEDMTLPGWGSWGGAGVKRNPHAKKFIKKVAGIDPTSRADHGKPHLIISEKKDKKAAKYLVNDLPYPYTSRAQFEKSMEVPIGTEWNTRLGFQRQTLPRIVKKMGTVIDPLEKMF